MQYGFYMMSRESLPKSEACPGKERIGGGIVALYRTFFLL
jgi:hypothetical protein